MEAGRGLRCRCPPLEARLRKILSSSVEALGKACLKVDVILDSASCDAPPRQTNTDLPLKTDFL